jgi:hypothetical protein
MVKEIYRIVLTDFFKERRGYRTRKEITSKEFIDLLREGEFSVSEEVEYTEVGVRIYELGELTPPTAPIGKLVFNDKTGATEFTSI